MAQQQKMERKKQNAVWDQSLEQNKEEQDYHLKWEKIEKNYMEKQTHGK